MDSLLSLKKTQTHIHAYPSHHPFTQTCIESHSLIYIPCYTHSMYNHIQHAYTHTCTHTLICTHIYLHSNSHIYTYHTYMYRHMYILICSQTHMHTHTCSRLKGGPPKISGPNHWHLLPFLGKASWLKLLRVLWWRDHPRLPRWALNAIIVFIRERQREMWHTCKEGILCEYRSRDWSDVNSPGMAVVTRGWKRRSGSPLEPLEGVQPHLQLDFSPVRLIFDFWPP